MASIGNKEYTDIFIDNVQKTFSIRKTSTKPNSALATLEKIEKILNENLIYSPSNAPDNDYSALLLNDMNTRINFFSAKFTEIHQGFRQKIGKVSWLVHKLYSKYLSSQKNMVDAVAIRIANYLAIPRDSLKESLNSYLPPELSQLVMDYNPVSIVPTVVQRAQNLGYEGVDAPGATHYLDILYYNVVGLSKDNTLPKRYWAFNSNTGVIDPQKILQNLDSLTPEDFITFLQHNRYVVTPRFIKILLNHAPRCVSLSPEERERIQKRINIPDQSGYTLLYKFSTQDLYRTGDRHVWGFPNETIVQWLLENGADPNIRSAGKTPLYVSASRDIAELLLQHQAEVNATTNQGETALHRAAATNDIKKIEVLLNHDAHIATPNALGKTPLHHAAFEGHSQAVELLLKRGAYAGVAGAQRYIIKSIEKSFITGMLLRAYIDGEPVSKEKTERLEWLSRLINAPIPINRDN